MIGLGGIFEEVLDNIKQLHAFDMLVELFKHFAFECTACIFAGLHASTGKRPEFFTLQTMKQNKAIVNNNCCGPKLKTMIGNVYGDHMCALTFDVRGGQSRDAAEGICKHSLQTVPLDGVANR